MKGRDKHPNSKNKQFLLIFLIYLLLFSTEKQIKVKIFEKFIFN